MNMPDATFTLKESKYPTMRVLQLIQLFPGGGAEKIGGDLVIALDKTQFSVGLICLYDVQPAQRERFETHGVVIYELHKKKGARLDIPQRIRQIVREFNADILHSHAATPFTYGYLATLGTHARHVHTMHNVAQKEAGWMGRQIRRFAFATRHTVPVNICQVTAQTFISEYHRRDAPVIYNGIAVQDYQSQGTGKDAWRQANGFQATDILYVCVAHIRDSKNHTMLVDAFAQGPAQHSVRTHLLIVGKVQQQHVWEQVQAKIEAVHLPGRIHFLGQRNDISSILQASDIFILASDWEGSPLSVIEAMAAGLPTITTNVGGLPELVINEKTGLLLPPRDQDAIAQAMTRLLDRDLRAQMGKQACQEAARFDVKVMAQAYGQLYQSLIRS
ncbi:MAG: glycosyltransferase [Anaerolineales bacterium]|nr:glycosyltransferase [Anaerolineales bacterium]